MRLVFKQHGVFLLLALFLPEAPPAFLFIPVKYLSILTTLLGSYSSVTEYTEWELSLLMRLVN